VQQIDIQQDKAELMEIARQVLDLARAEGATAAEVDIGTGSGLAVTARIGEVETIEHQRDKGLSITVYMGHQKGNSSSTDFAPAALKNSVQAACTIARLAGADDYSGLLDPQYLATTVPDLDLYHPWAISAEQAIEMAIGCESAARESDQRIINSDGATLNSYSGCHVYGNTNHFINGWDWSSHSLDCTVIAEQDGKMQRDGWYSRTRDHRDLQEITAIGAQAAARTVARLGARKLTTRNIPVIFEAPVATSLFGSFIAAISGGALYRKSSFLLDKLGTQVFADHVNISEQPHLKKAAGSTPFDNDGMATQQRALVDCGMLQGYVLSAYSARKLGMAPTGNAGGVHNLVIESGTENLQALMKQMHTGLLITELIGFGVNTVTGDYSRGASGLWIENGEIQYPVEEVTVAGNLADMYKKITAIANDVDRRGNIQTGSVLIEEMMVAGA
jgi:PmbA protein